MPAITNDAMLIQILGDAMSRVIDDLKQDFNKYWGLILDTISIDSFISFSPEQQDLIEDAYRSLNSSIYNFKVSLFK